MQDLQHAVSDLEAEIDALHEAAGRCRKIMSASKALVGVGGLLLALTVLGPLAFQPAAPVAGIAAGLAGLALYGSNRSSLGDIAGRIRACEARRDAAIDRIAPQPVEPA